MAERLDKRAGARWLLTALPIAAMLLLALGGPMATAAQSGKSSTLTGVVTHVTDGDTLWLRVDGSARSRSHKPVALRMLGIDAPERCQAGGPEATAALKNRVLKRKVTVKLVSKDAYRRWLAEVQLDGADLNAWMVQQGHAWSAKSRRSPGRYAAEEHAARSARRGLFADLHAIEPGVFRKRYGACASGG